MTRTALAAAFVVLLGLALPGAVALGAQQQAALSPDESAAVGRAVRYLNQLSTVRSRFVQVSSNGAYAEGEVIVKRPGKLRFEYDPPHPALMIADGLTLLYYDRELKQASFLPLWETPLWFLIRDEVKLSDKVEVTNVEQGQGALRVTLRDRSLAEGGTVTLVFADDPLSLKKWEVVDAQGIATQVSLLNPQFGVQVDSKAFDYSDLEISTGRARQQGR